jgi:hypothetical protein
LLPVEDAVDSAGALMLGIGGGPDMIGEGADRSTSDDANVGRGGGFEASAGPSSSPPLGTPSAS